jgi:uncharacterized protein
MKTLISALFVYILTSTIAFAADTPPSPESLRRLMEITQVKKLFESAMGNIDASMDSGIKMALKGKQLTVSEQQMVDDMRDKMAAVIRQDFTWESMEPMFMDIYSRSLSQSDVDGMLAFYATKAGKAMIAKMPLIMQNTMQAMQTRMSALAPKIVEIQQEALARLKAPPAS